MSLEQKIEDLTTAVAQLNTLMSQHNELYLSLLSKRTDKPVVYTEEHAEKTKEAVDSSFENLAQSKTKPEQKTTAVKTKPAPKKEEPTPEVEETKPDEVTYDTVIQSFIKLYEKDKAVNGDSAPVCMDILTKLNIKGRDGGPPKISYVEEDRYTEAFKYIQEGMAKFETKKKDVSFV